MKKKLLAVFLSFIFAFTMFGLTGCGGSEDAEEAQDTQDTPQFSEEYTAFADAVDVDFAKEVMTKVSEFGDDDAVGMRTAGSPAEKETCDYLEGVMKDIGLKNVTVDEANVDGWTFNGASITFKNAKGKEVTADLGGYQTTIQADNQEAELMYVGKGTEADYNGIDVKGKIVLFEVNTEEEWWTNYPAYQAKSKGAICAIAMREFAEKDENGDRIGVQDYCGPANAPCLAISIKDCKALKKAIDKYGDGSIEASIKVTLNADSKVTENVKTHNLYGEIPGKTDETVFVFSHMDGYFHAAYDDAQGVGVSLAQAKALIDSGYTPDRTIRFCIHGSEEWGREGSEYDWSTGAYEEINTNHPDWVNGAIAIVNNDGGYAVADEINNGVMTSTELKKFTKESMSDVVGDFPGKWHYDSLSTYTEDFYWTRVGIPAISAGVLDSETRYDDIGYHSTYDSFDAQPLDEDALATTVKAYGKVIIDLDSLNVRPMNFKARIKEFEKSLDAKAGDQFDEVIAEGYEAAEALQAKMDQVEESGDKEAAVELNKQTQEIYQTLQGSLLGLDFMDVDAEIAHLMYQENLDVIDDALDALEKGSADDAYDIIGDLDWAWYDMNFDEETCAYMRNQLFEKRDDTWGKDMIKFPQADTFALVRSLELKCDDEKADLSEDITKLNEIRQLQQEHLDEIYEDELEGLQTAVELMKKYSK